MSVSYIPEKIKIRLWGKAAGRCEYEGCNKRLWLDSITKAEFNTAYIAHIIADKPNGPRGDKVLSDKIKQSISNLMLICDDHHRLIDIEDVNGHSVERLKKMKQKHESRIETLTSISEEKQSHVILYGANIGNQNLSLNIKQASLAMIPGKYPAEKHAIELSLKNSLFIDHENIYWGIEIEHLRRQYEQKIASRLISGDINHISVFAIAPQPLLIELGRLISDIHSVDVYQLHREPPTWKWQNHPDGFDFIINKPSSFEHTPVLIISLSGKINPDRVFSVLNEKLSIWELTVKDCHNDLLKSQAQLSMFRETVRHLLVSIKEHHGNKHPLRIFPAMPISCAVEFGRVRMPKADMPFIIYDQNNKAGKFIEAIKIPGELNG